MAQADPKPPNVSEPVGAHARIDAAHLSQPARNAVEAQPAEMAFASTEQGESAAEQMQSQADQLASYLRSRQQAIDHREAELNAHLAEVDTHARRERLLLSQREMELAEREAELATRQQDLEERLTCLAVAEEEIRNRNTRLAAERKQQSRAQQHRQAARDADHEQTIERLKKREQAQEQAERWLREQQEEHAQAVAGFDERCRRAEDEALFQRQQVDAHRAASLAQVQRLQAAVERQRESLEQREQKWANVIAKPKTAVLRLEENLQREAAALKQRRSQLDEAELKLAEAQAKAAALCEQLGDDRRREREELRDERRRLALEHRNAMADVQEQRDALGRQSEYVDNCRTNLVQMRAELSEMHRETLDMRIATEELWGQLSGSTPSAALAESLAAIRKRLSRHYDEASADLKQQKAELEAARAEMAEQLEGLMRRKAELDDWGRVREEEILRQATRLRERETEIRKRECELAESAHLRESERLHFEAEVDRLQRRIGELESQEAPVGV